MWWKKGSQLRYEPHFDRHLLYPKTRAIFYDFKHDPNIIFHLRPKYKYFAKKFAFFSWNNSVFLMSFFFICFRWVANEREVLNALSTTVIAKSTRKMTSTFWSTGRHYFIGKWISSSPLSNTIFIILPAWIYWRHKKDRWSFKIRWNYNNKNKVCYCRTVGNATERFRCDLKIGDSAENRGEAYFYNKKKS